MKLSTAKNQKRNQLLDQGVVMLMNQGYHGSGLKEILDAVKIPKGSFYNYFGSKEQFAAEAIAYYITPFINKLQSHLDRSGPDALAGLRNYYQELIVEIERNEFKGGCLLGNLMAEIGDTSEICRQSLAQTIQQYRALQASALKKAQQQGTVRTDQTAEDMADVLLNNWQGALLRMKIEQSVHPLQQCCQLLLDDYFKA